MNVKSYSVGLLAFAISALSANGMEATTVVTERIVDGIPVIEGYQKDMIGKMPLVILSHGFSRDKRMYTETSEAKFLFDALIEQGCFVVAMDNRAHGERPGKKFKEIAMSGLLQFDTLAVRKLIKESADDVSTLIDHYCRSPRVDSLRIGVSGISMGGFVSIRAAVNDKRIIAIAPMIAGGYWEDIPEVPFPLRIKKDSKHLSQLKEYCEQFSPNYHLDELSDISILMQNGSEDKHVHPEYVGSFFEELKQKNRDARLIMYPGLGHEVNKEMLETVAEFMRTTMKRKYTSTEEIRNYYDYSVPINGTADEIFTNLCVKRELDWLPDWKYKDIFSTSGYMEQGCVYSVPREFNSEEVLTYVSRYDRSRKTIELVKFAPNLLVVIRIAIHESEGPESILNLSFETTALNASGTALERSIRSQFSSLSASVGENLENFLNREKN